MVKKITLLSAVLLIVKIGNEHIAQAHVQFFLQYDSTPNEQTA